MFTIDVEFTNGERRHYDGANISDIAPDWIELKAFNEVPESEGDRIIIPMQAIKCIREHESLYQPKKRYQHGNEYLNSPRRYYRLWGASNNNGKHRHRQQGR